MSRHIRRISLLALGGRLVQNWRNPLKENCITSFTRIWLIPFQWTFFGLLGMHMFFLIVMPWIRVRHNPEGWWDSMILNVIETLLDTTGSLFMMLFSNTLLAMLLRKLTSYGCRLRPFHLKLCGLLQFFFFLCTYAFFKMTNKGPYG